MTGWTGRPGASAMSMSAPPEVTDRQPVVFRLAPVYRRCGLYLLPGFVAVVPNRVEVTAAGGPPRTVAEADWRLAELDRRERELRKGVRFLTALALTVFCL